MHYSHDSEFAHLRLELHETWKIFELPFVISLRA